MEARPTTDESLGALLRGIMLDLRTLVREEIALARVEIREQVGHARAAAIGFGLAVGALSMGGLFLLIALALALAELLNWPTWVGFLIVAVLLSLVGVIAFAIGRQQVKKVRGLPEETVTSIKENSEWIAKRLSSVRR